MNTITRRTFAIASLASLFPVYALAKGVDYSELDGMTVSELEDLDTEIQKRLERARLEEESSTGNPSFQNMSAEEILLQMKADGMPINDYMVYDESNDENGLLGRPGSYTSKVNFNDISLGYDPTFDVNTGGSIEVFANNDDCQARADYIASVAKTFSTASEYDYVYGVVLLRLSKQYLPSQAENWESELKNPQWNDLDTENGNSFQLLQISEQTWHWYDSGYGQTHVKWAAIASNLNEDLSLTYALFVATAYAEDGIPLGSSEANCSKIWPLSTGAVGGIIDTGGIVPARVDVTARGGSLADNWHAETLNDKPRFEIQNLAETPSDFLTTFTGSLGNYMEQAEDLTITIVLRHSDGTLADVVTGYMDNAPAQSWQDFSITAQPDTAPHDQIEATADRRFY